MAINADLEKRYSEYPTRELLKILHHSSDYLPETITIIERILASRQIDPSEEAAIKYELLQEFLSAEQQKVKMERKWPALFMLQKLITQPRLVKNDDYLLLFLQVLLGIYYLVLLPGRLKVIYLQFELVSGFSFFFICINLIQLVSTPVVIVLLWHRKKSGWIFCSLGKWIETTYLIIALQGILPYLDFIPTSARLEFFLHFLLLSGILVILNYKRTRIALGISKATTLTTIAGGIFAGLLYYFILTSLYN